VPSFFKETLCASFGKFGSELKSWLHASILFSVDDSSIIFGKEGHLGQLDSFLLTLETRRRLFLEKTTSWVSVHEEFNIGQEVLFKEKFTCLELSQHHMDNRQRA
jgi:hypothetical protein